jgi:hypothetical protein
MILEIAIGDAFGAAFEFGRARALVRVKDYGAPVLAVAK